MTVATAHELKGLETQLSKVRAEIDVLKAEADRTRSRLNLANEHRVNLESRIRALQTETAEPKVSEHAILRWLERVDGVNLEEVKARILSGNTATAIKFAKSGNVTTEGHKIVFRDYTVVTVE